MTPNAGGDVEQVTSRSLLSGVESGRIVFSTAEESLTELSIGFPFKPATVSLDICPNEP